MYIVWIPYNALYCSQFDTIFQYINDIPNYNHSFKEKKSILWIKLDTILSNSQTINLRNVFYNTIHHHAKQLESIALELKGRNIKNI